MRPTTQTPRHTRRTRAVGICAAALLSVGAVGCTAESGAGDSSSVHASTPDSGGQAGGDTQEQSPASPGPSVPSSAPPAGQPGSGDASVSTPPHTGGRASWCPTEALTVSIRQLSPAAGNRYAALVVTNTSRDACRTRGWPGLQFVDGEGARLPTDTVWDRAHEAPALTLPPSGRAYSRLHWAVVPGEADEGPCPAPAALHVIPPDQRTATTAAWSHGEVCGAGRITATAFTQGAGPR